MPEIVPESHILEPPNTAVSYKFSLQLVLGHQYLVKNPGDRMCPRGVLLFLAKLRQAVVALNTTRRCPCSFTKISLGLGRYITVIILVGGILTPLKNISQFGMIIPIYYGK